MVPSEAPQAPSRRTLLRTDFINQFAVAVLHVLHEPFMHFMRRSYDGRECR